MRISTRPRALTAAVVAAAALVALAPPASAGIADANCETAGQGELCLYRNIGFSGGTLDIPRQYYYSVGYFTSGTWTWLNSSPPNLPIENDTGSVRNYTAQSVRLFRDIWFAGPSSQFSPYATDSDLSDNAVGNNTTSSFSFCPMQDGYHFC